MKILSIIVTLLLGLAWNLNSQIIYSNDFENGLGDMKVVDMDGQNPHPNTTEFTGTWSELSADRFEEYNSNAVVANSYYLPSGKSNDWLITPAVSIPNGAVLTWDAFSLDKLQADNYEIRVSTTGDNPSDFTDLIFTVDAEEGELKTRNVSLNDYAGRTIHIAFRSISNDKFLLILDNISVRLPYERDAYVRSLQLGLNKVPAFNKNTTLFGPRSVKASILNFGSKRITNMKVVYTLNGQTFSEDITVNLNPGDAHTYETEVMNIPIGSDHVIEMQVISVNGTNDQDLTNNNDFAIFDSYPPVPFYKFNDSRGKELNLHETLLGGKSVLLFFFDKNCGSCEESVTSLNNYYLSQGGANGKLQIVGVSVGPGETNADISGLGWSATFPMISYKPFNEVMWVHFTKNHGLDQGISLPYFVQICPNTNVPGFSTINAHAQGFTIPSMFNIDFRPIQETCQAGISDVNEIAFLNNITAYPNPNASGMLNIAMGVDTNNEVRFSIADLGGRMIKNLGKKRVYQGENLLNFDLSDLNSGIYILNMESEGQQANIKLTVVK